MEIRLNCNKFLLALFDVIIMKRAKSVLKNISSRLNHDFESNHRDPRGSDNEHYIMLMREIQLELNEWMEHYNPLG